MKKLFALLLALTLVIGLCGCETTQQKMEALNGTYSATVSDTAEEAEKVLENIDVYPSELALADLNSLSYVRMVTFNLDGTYAFAYDVDGTKACVRKFYDGYFGALFEDRSTLNADYAAYEVDFTEMDEEAFKQFYADLYKQENYEALLDYLAERAYDYTALSEPWERGTYRITGNKIVCLVDGETQEESIAYTLEGDTLTLEFSNATIVHTKIS